MTKLEIDEDGIKELAAAMQHGDRDEAFIALDVVIRDHPEADTIRHWIDCARFARRSVHG